MSPPLSRKPRLGGVLLAATLLSGCATVAPSLPPPPPPRYEPPPLAPAPELGAATLVGRMAAPSRRGAVWSCEGQSAVLLRATPATSERMRSLYGSLTAATAPVESVKRRSAAAGASGPGEPPVASATCSDRAGFTLPGIAPGAYFVVARARLQGGGGSTSYALMRRVVLQPGETAVVVLPAVDSLGPRGEPARAGATRRSRPARPPR